jgi:hypothetical protein
MDEWILGETGSANLESLEEIQCHKLKGNRIAGQNRPGGIRVLLAQSQSSRASPE